MNAKYTYFKARYRLMISVTGNGMADLTSPTFRVLRVAELVAEKGPITLSELCEELPISRAAIWRALNVLRSSQWVRMRLGDHAFEINFQLSELISVAPAKIEFAQKYSPLMQYIDSTGVFFAKMGMFTDTGKFSVIESNRTDMRNSYTRSMVFDVMAIAAQIPLPEKQLRRHLEAFQLEATADETALIMSGEHLTCLTNFAENGIVWSIDLDSFSFPVGHKQGFEGAIEVSLKRSTSKSKALLKQYAAELLKLVEQYPDGHFSGSIPKKFGGIKN